MAKNKRFTNNIHRIYDNNEEIACADTMDDAETIINRLNEQDNLIKELESENKMLKITISRNEAYIKRVTTKGKWSNTGDVDD